METIAQVFLMEPLLFGGKVLPFAIISGIDSNFTLGCGLLDIEAKKLNYNVCKYGYNNRHIIETQIKFGDIIAHYRNLSIYNLIMQHHPDILSPLDKINFKETNIYRILVLMSHPDYLPLLKDLNIMASKIDSNLSYQIKEYAGSDPNLQPEFYWNVLEV